MTIKVTVKDGTLTGADVNQFQLDFPSGDIDVRELIRSRVYQEVRDFNAGVGTHFRGLIQPQDAEPDRQGFRLPDRRKIDWQEQYEKSIEAFSKGRVLILADNRQLESLDDRLDVNSVSEITFLRLVPLVGG